MIRIPLSFAIGFIWAALHLLPSASPKPGDATPLDAVLKKMDAASASFRTTQAEFEWDRYERVIDEIDDVQSGTIYYRRNSKETEMKADIKKSGASATEQKLEPKFVLFAGGKIRMYQPKPDQVTEYDLGKNSSDFESYLVLGFGGSGQELVKSFDITYLGHDTVNGVETDELQLVPKSEKVRNTFKRILLWIDPERGISIQQQFFEPQGDYRLAKYWSIKMNEKIGNDVFQLKTTSKTRTIIAK